MNVVYVTTIERGGGLSHLRILAPAVAREGIGVHVVCATDAVASGFRADGVSTSVLPIRSKTDLRGAARLRPLLRGSSLVHTHDRRAGLFGRAQARLVGAKALHTLHGVPEEIAVRLGSTAASTLPGTSPLRSAWFRWGYPQVETLLASLGDVIVPTHVLARFLADHGLSRRRIHVIRYPVVGGGPIPVTAHGPTLRVMTAANLEYWKGLDLLLAACAQVRTPVRLDVFGDGSLRDELVREADARAVDATFHGFVTEVGDRLAEADVFVLPSRGDNSPMALLEAMAMGLPVVATRVGGIPELIDHDETGLLVAPEDAQGIAAAIERLASDDDLRRRLGAQAAAHVAAEFSLERVVRATIGLYEELCGSST